jgi:hypothetical protein
MVIPLESGVFMGRRASSGIVETKEALDRVLEWKDKPQFSS